MSSGKPIEQRGHAVRVESLGYLHCRIREEAEAAVKAVSLEATLAHVHLATAYAHRISEQSSRVLGPDDRWADRHRVW